MRRILGLDFGEKRIGVSISDQTGKIALAYGLLAISDQRQGIREIKKICQKEKIGKIVLGLPITLKGKEGQAAEKIRQFGQKLKEEISLPIIFEDERFSTKEAEKILKQLKIKKGREKIDTLSAILILKQYLEREDV